MIQQATTTVSTRNSCVFTGVVHSPFIFLTKVTFPAQATDSMAYTEASIGPKFLISVKA